MTYAEQIAAIAAEIAPILKEEFDPHQYAVGLIEEDHEDDGHYEVRAFHTKTGVPHTFRV